MVLQALAERHGVELRDRLVNPGDGRPAGVSGEYREGEQTVKLLMPLTMMNESGDVFRAAAAAPEELLIVCDDVNLPLGALRLRPQGGAGGHQGLQSCLEALGTEQVARLRVGIGTAELPSDLESFVLSPFRREERPKVKRMIEQAAEACEAWVREGIETAMNRYNRLIPPVAG
jgi:PTH1 family peptidyl-tRNA hydrolase